MKIKSRDMTVDITKLDVGFGLDASRWSGRVTIDVPGRGRRGRSTVTAYWKGAEGSTEGMLVDVEGEDERACEIVEARTEELAEAISAKLADPCSSEERSRLDAYAEWFDEGVGRRVA